MGSTDPKKHRRPSADRKPGQTEPGRISRRGWKRPNDSGWNRKNLRTAGSPAPQDVHEEVMHTVRASGGKPSEKKTVEQKA